MMRRTMGVVLVLLLVCVGTGCKMSEQDEIKLGRDSHPKFEQEFGGRYQDAQVQTYVNTIGMSMARQAGRPNLDWQYHVLNSDQINAFAVPGGYIYLTQGLLFKLNNEAQLAGVLGHESGHIKNKHSVKQIEKAQLASGAAGVAGVVGSVFGVGGVGNIAGVVAQLSLLKYGRGQEEEADYAGLKYMSAAGYNPQGMVQTMQILKAETGKGGSTPQFLSTHPDPGNRVEYLTAAIKKDYTAPAQTGKLGEAEFQSNILTRRHASITPIDLSRPNVWCLTCREDEITRIASTKQVKTGQELLHDAK